MVNVKNMKSEFVELLAELSKLTQAIGRRIVSPKNDDEDLEFLIKALESVGESLKIVKRALTEAQNDRFLKDKEDAKEEMTFFPPVVVKEPDVDSTPKEEPLEVNWKTENFIPDETPEMPEMKTTTRRELKHKERLNKATYALGTEYTMGKGKSVWTLDGYHLNEVHVTREGAGRNKMYIEPEKLKRVL